jgi:hypothetical protein
MSAEDYIAQLRDTNRSLFSADYIKIRPAELERLMMLAWVSGHAEGIRDHGSDLFDMLFSDPHNERPR